MKKNTTIFDSLIDEIFNALNEVNEPTQDKTCNDCDKCNCKHFHSHDEDESEEEEENDESYNPNFEVMSYTDEDFTDKEKLEDYVDELENLLIELDNMDEKEAALFSYFSKWSGMDIKSFIEERIDHAYQVYNDSVKAKKEDAKLMTRKLASDYVDNVFVDNFEKMGGKLTDSQINTMKNQFTSFANWILEQ